MAGMLNASVSIFELKMASFRSVRMSACVDRAWLADEAQLCGVLCGIGAAGAQRYDCRLS